MDGVRRGPGWSQDHQNGFIMFKIELQMYTYRWLGYAVYLKNYLTEPIRNGIFSTVR